MTDLEAHDELILATTRVVIGILCLLALMGVVWVVAGYA